MSKDMIRLMQALFMPGERTLPWQPAADVYRTPYGWLVKFDVAGVRPGDIELTAHERRLILRGCRRDSVTEKGCRCYTMEISYSAFERTIELPEPLEHARISAEHQEGMLLVRIQTEEAQRDR